MQETVTLRCSLSVRSVKSRISPRETTPPHYLTTSTLMGITAMWFWRSIWRHKAITPGMPCWLIFVDLLYYISYDEAFGTLSKKQLSCVLKYKKKIREKSFFDLLCYSKVTCAARAERVEQLGWKSERCTIKHIVYSVGRDKAWRG